MMNPSDDEPRSSNAYFFYCCSVYLHNREFVSMNGVPSTVHSNDARKKIYPPLVKPMHHDKIAEWVVQAQLENGETAAAPQPLGI